MKPTLLIMAAGIGSRYGGLKQMEKIGPSGETIMDYSAYDAVQSGFGKVVFIIKKNIEKEFNDIIINKYSSHIPVDYVIQEIDSLPEGTNYNKDRVKPWGTGHAVLMAAEKVKEPFVVINSDDFYSRPSYLATAQYFNSGATDYCMIGFLLKNTLSEHGSVARGVCEVNKDDYLLSITERTNIQKQPEGIFFIDNNIPASLNENTVVSMNCWGFSPDYFGYLKEEFNIFLKDNAMSEKTEFYLPSVVNKLISNNIKKVKVLKTDSQWFGVTYKPDKQMVVNRILSMVKEGIYPEKLW